MRSKYGVLLVGLMILVVLGLSLLQDYGTSVDEELNAYYGSLTLRAYQTGSLLRSPGIDYFNGTFYFMVFTITSQLFRVLNPGWLATDGRHLTNFLIFLVGVYFFYRMSMRLFPRGASLFLCALFASQPVLFGHAFINQKDVPLMVFFLASVELGLTAMDRLRLLPGRPLSVPEPEDPGSVPREPWRRLLRGLRSTWGLLAACALLLVIDLWLTRFGEQLSKDLVATAYTGGGPDWLARLFASVATDAYKTPLEAYLAKVVQGFLWIRLASLPVVLATALGLWRASFPENYRRSMDGWVRRWGGLIVGGAVLGGTTSIRILGPFAGLLVAIYAFARAGRRALPALALYATVAAVATYMTWPVLWGDPIGVFLDRAARASGFVQHEVFLLGTEYESNNLPWHYLPTLLGLQLTVPAVVLVLTGIPFSLAHAVRSKEDRVLAGVIWIWLLAPLLMVAGGLMPIYDNFRHVLFILPALFLVAGGGLNGLGKLIRSARLRVGLALLAFLPGAAGIVQLHPYEYIYYNELIGGIRGASGRFELDYWCTAFRDAMAFVNEEAGPNARVGFVGGAASAVPFAREDLHLYTPTSASGDPDMAVLGCRLVGRQASLFADMQTVHETRRNGVLLALVKEHVLEP